MIYKSMGGIVGESLYDNIGAFIIFFPFMVMPQLILSVYMMRNIYSEPQSLIDANMFNPEELQTGPFPNYMVIPTIIAITLLSIGGGYLKVKRFQKIKS